MMRVGRSRWLRVATALVLLVIAAVIFRATRQAEDRVWNRIQRTGVWRVGMDPSFPPFESLDQDGRPLGYDVDLARAIAAGWGVEVTFEGIGFDGLLASLWADRADSVLSALPYDPRMTQDVAYSVPYFEAGLLLVVAGDAVDIASTDDLEGRALAVEWGSEGDVQGRGLRRRFPSIVLWPLPVPQDVLAAVETGEADAALVDAISLLQFQDGSADVRSVGLPVVSMPYVIAMPRESPVLLKAVNEAILSMQQDGTLEHLEAEWLRGG